MRYSGFGRKKEDTTPEIDQPIRVGTGSVGPSRRAGLDMASHHLVTLPLSPVPSNIQINELVHRPLLVSDSAPHAVTEKDIANNIEDFYAIKNLVSSQVFEMVDLTHLADVLPEIARDELTNICINILDNQGITITRIKRDKLIRQICDDIIGLGPLEPLIARDDISDIMVNTADKVYIEVGGKTQLTSIRFRDNAQLANVCQRIVYAVGRRVDEGSPICDARLKDGSRVNVVFPPIAYRGPSLTIRKFRKDRLTLDKLVEFGSLTTQCAAILRIAATCRANILISGGTGSGKTTLLNCLTKYISEDERIVTCEDVAELQLQQPHVVSMEARPQNLEGAGEVSMRDLVKTCLRMRPERIIVGEVRGQEAFDLLQAMNTGHDGSMGTVHANSAREALSRLENMVAMAGFNFPSKVVREQIAAAIDLVVQIQRMKDGSRRVVNVAEIAGMEGETILTQDIIKFEFGQIAAGGKIVGTMKSSGIRPLFYEKAQYYDLDAELISAVNDSFYAAPLT